MGHEFSWREADQIFRKLNADPYKVLSVSENSSLAEIKSQYYRLCRELHPDTVNSTEDAPRSLGVSKARWKSMDLRDKRVALGDKFIEVNAAYQVLSNAALKHKYDAYTKYRQGSRAWTPHGAVEQQQAHDPWQSEHPVPHGTRPQTEEEKLNDRRIKWGIFGFFGVLFIVTGLQRLVQYEDQMRVYGMENLKSMRMMSVAREHAMEKWREVPPESIMEYEATNLRAQAAAATAPASSHTDDNFKYLWPYGSGLGLIALLGDNQLCGVESRRRVATDDALAHRRRLVQHALEGDRVVRKYMTQSSCTSRDDPSALRLPAPNGKTDAHGQ